MDLPALAVFDVDGTLVSFDGTCSAVTRDLLAALRSAGVVTAIATGRPTASIGETIELTGPVDFAVCGNGSTVTELATGRLLRCSTVPSSSVVSVASAVRAALGGVGLALEFGDRVIEEPGLHVRLPPREPVPTVDDAVAAAGTPPPDVQRMIFFHDDYDGDLPALADIIRPHLDDGLELFHGMLLPIVEVIPAGDNKATALADLVRHLGISASEAVAFGDGSNDIDMLAWAGCGVAMGSASVAVRAAADAVTATVEDDGVARFLRPLLDDAFARGSEGSR